MRELIAQWPEDLRVGVIASGGLSHFVVDEPGDLRVLENLGEGRAVNLKSFPKGALNSGSSEILNWILMAGAIEHLKKRWYEYHPLYRQAAGSGIGVAFGTWAP